MFVCVCVCWGLVVPGGDRSSVGSSGSVASARSSGSGQSAGSGSILHAQAEGAKVSYLTCKVTQLQLLFEKMPERTYLYIAGLNGLNSASYLVKLAIEQSPRTEKNRSDCANVNKHISQGCVFKKHC